MHYIIARTLQADISVSAWANDHRYDFTQAKDAVKASIGVH